MRGSGDLIWGGAESAPPPIWGTFSTWDPKNGSQPQNSPRLRYYNTKRTQKLCETCRNRHLSVSWILPSFCSRQGPPLWNWANFDHFCPLPARPNVIWLQKVVSYTPFTYLGKVKKNWQLFPLIFFGESQKYERGGILRPPPHQIGLRTYVRLSDSRSEGPACCYSKEGGFSGGCHRPDRYSQGGRGG